MASTRRRPHLEVPAGKFRRAESYTPFGRLIKPRSPGAPLVGRPAHAESLKVAIDTAIMKAAKRRESTGFKVPGAVRGVYLDFEALSGWELALSSLESNRSQDPKKRIEVVAVRQAHSSRQHAAVFVPEGKIKHFLGQLEKYARETPKRKGEARHENTYDRVASLRLATLRALWTDDEAAYPATDYDPIWWEIWLRRSDGAELSRLYAFAALANLRLGERRIQFDDRIVTLVFGSADQLSASLDVLNDLAEVRRAKELATFFIQQAAKDQAEWVNELADRVESAGQDAPAVCVLDTGVARHHPLLAGALAADDCHAVDVSWGTYDHEGHGSEMAGLALYPDFISALAGSERVVLRHGLETVKILPPTGSNNPDLYGAITASGASRPEIQAPKRRRVFLMAVTTRDSRDRGQPTSWSAAVDALAAGRSFDPSNKGLIYFDESEATRQRLFVVSAGNVEGGALEPVHLDRSDSEPVHDPAQAWNALTVGAHTEKAVITDPTWSGWSPVAPAGELSPWSTTSMTFGRQWPIKPDVVMEGGNVVRDAAGNVDFPCDDLCLLTTYFKPAEKPFVSTWATSAAAAQVARIAASVSAVYPDLWPETIRGLVVHSAEWTATMKAHLAGASGKAARAQLVRRYGFGVPSLERALKSADNAVTLLVQDSLRPFADGKMREIHFYELPWPREVLASLGDANVRVRVTLSYFVEPNPGRRGWQRKHRYQSHGLRFSVKGPTESVDEFHKRLNQMALAEEEGRPSTGSDSENWYLGDRARNRGSLHSDILTGFAADIAERGVIAVYPVTGWWKEVRKRDQRERDARYALLVSIETDAVDTDIWTPIAFQVGVPVGLETG
ncbi:MAG: S8 family peptidase [Thermoanaerobaculia bacterium]|nr:S8 family peptidase [Thermoanaerobaculia bacterium]